jgi:AbrB family looped-hinge helix DNA binding protein
MRRVRTGRILIMRVGSKGEVTIPVEIREQLGLLPLCEVELEVVGDAVQIRRVEGGSGARGRSLVAQLRGRGSVAMTTDEIMALTRGAEDSDAR